MNLKLGIVGWPLTKTYSPLIHKLLGEFLGINVEYQKVPIENLDRQKFKMLIQNLMVTILQFHIKTNN